MYAQYHKDGYPSQYVGKWMFKHVLRDCDTIWYTPDDNKMELVTDTANYHTIFQGDPETFWLWLSRNRTVTQDTIIKVILGNTLSERMYDPSHIFEFSVADVKEMMSTPRN